MKYRTTRNLVLIAFAAYSGSALQAEDASVIARGEVLFSQQCASCHSLAMDAIAPPLGGVTRLFSKAELTERIRDSGKIIESGDARANALFRRYKVMMPPFTHLTEIEIDAILAYIDAQSQEQKLTALVLDSETPVEEPRLIPPVVKTDLVIELEEVVQIPRLPGRTPYKGITLLRPDPRENGAMLILDLMGIIYRVKGGDVSTFLDIRNLFPEFITEPGVATGLGSLALHPEFATNGIFYTVHSENFRGSPAINSSNIPPDVPAYETPPLEWVLTEWILSDSSSAALAGTHREVLRIVTPTTGHNLQEIAFAPVNDPGNPDYGMLYLACGDGGAVNMKRPELAGHPRSLYGTILRIDPMGTNGVGGSYGIPPDNPFAQSGDPSIHKEIWAYGFRNPHRISWDMTHGKRMIAVDIGESNVEEVNLVEPGGSYGWGLGSIEGSTRINVKVDPKVVFFATEAELAPFNLPLAQYDHSDGQAITGGYVYHGSIEALRGKYIFGDIVNGRLFYMNMDAGITDRTIYELSIIRNGEVRNIKELAGANRAHLRFAYDDRTNDMFILTKDDGMVRRITAGYRLKTQ